MTNMTYKKSTPIRIHIQASDTNNDVAASSNIPQEIMAHLIYHILSHVLSLEYIVDSMQKDGINDSIWSSYSDIEKDITSTAPL